MLTYTYVDKGKFALIEKEKPTIIEPTDAIVKVTLASICSSDIHIKHGAVPRAVKGITVGHEMVGIVEETGSAVTNVNVGDRVTVNVETFCGECFFCKNGYVNNCTDKNGGWALGCRIDGGQAEYVRVPLANTGLNKIPDAVSDEQALLVGDVLATGYWAARISEITEDDTVLIIGAGPTGICTLLCVMLKHPKKIIVCETDDSRIAFINKHYPEVLTVKPENCVDFVEKESEHGGADVVIEAAGADASQILWQLDDGIGSMLPVMQTDIMLSYQEKILIIDAKYYGNTTQTRFGTHTLHSGNLYQIFTYVKNKEAELASQPHEVSGMLLYAKTDEEIYPDNKYQMSGNQITVRTLDLNLPFSEIAEQLNMIVMSHFDLSR